ncbi:hypothetical protein GCM10011412_25770 [Maribacter cobaltidurans]|nr:hypothetical protein GCM10011412_25770 [Maribacter cobaltidurans]
MAWSDISWALMEIVLINAMRDKNFKIFIYSSFKLLTKSDNHGCVAHTIKLNLAVKIVLP